MHKTGGLRRFAAGVGGQHNGTALYAGLLVSSPSFLAVRTAPKISPKAARWRRVIICLLPAPRCYGTARAFRVPATGWGRRPPRQVSRRSELPDRVPDHGIA